MDDMGSIPCKGKVAILESQNFHNQSLGMQIFFVNKSHWSKTELDVKMCRWFGVFSQSCKNDKNDYICRWHVYDNYNVYMCYDAYFL